MTKERIQYLVRQYAGQKLSETEYKELADFLRQETNRELFVEAHNTLPDDELVVGSYDDTFQPILMRTLNADKPAGPATASPETVIASLRFLRRWWVA